MSANLYSLLRSRFPRERDSACLLIGDEEAVSYGQIEAQVGRLSAWLVRQGVIPGERVLVQAAKVPEILPLYLAVLNVGGVYTPLNDAYTPAEVDYFIGDARPALIVRDAAAAAREAEGMAPFAGTVARAADDLAALIYTSGTTGRSKGAMVTHGNLAANALALHDIWGFSRDDVLLHALPVFHVHGLFVAIHCALLSGAPMLWLAKFDAAELIRVLPRASVMMGVPTFYTRLLADPAFSRERAAHIRLFISGSAPLLPSTFAEFEARTGHRILERYGMSEAGMIASNPLAGERIAGSVGYPLPGVGLRLSGSGGIEIAGPSLFRGYWDMPDKTRAEFTEDGWFMTGDVGRLDADGRLWITGRAKDLIISGGYNIYPKEIELVLDEVAGVTESAVIGVPHPDFGEAVVAAVIGDADEGALLARARERLAAFKVPKRVLFLEALPRNAMGKVRKNVLRERFGGLFAQPKR
jgi:malonyl-CoA/methylmalonyl-CoA synthetase